MSAVRSRPTPRRLWFLITRAFIFYSKVDYDINDIFSLATKLVIQSSRDIFLTGKAGTGKTTFLKYIRENCPKQMAVVAPTGVAAINAGGVTMHSFFQLPFSPFVPASGGVLNQEGDITNRSNLLSRLRMTNEKKRILQELELLIIDEISMVRCDMLDAVDAVLRHTRRRHHERFGGVQVLFIGDMFQLPPVIKEQEWMLLKEFYSSPYFFDSHVIKEEPPVYIEFEKIYRQSEEKFIDILNQVRNNELDDEGRKLLERRFLTGFKRIRNDGYIILTTHNEKARIKNESELNKLETNMFSYSGELEGDFSESSCPVERDLRLKVGAQVMFIKNDVEKAKRYFNGKIGIVKELDNNKILVQCKDEPEAIEVRKEKWDNIRYSVDKTTRQINEEVLGSFKQYPLRLAWAITIHKSQGLTFEKVIIDAGEAFAPGQVYVALSRCTTINGIVLQSRIRSTGMFTDERIVQFSKANASKNVLELELQRARKNYRLKILLSLFDYSRNVIELKELNAYLAEHRSSYNDDGGNWLGELINDTENVQATAQRFKRQLEKLVGTEDSGSSEVLNGRISAGAQYFLNEQKKLVDKLLNCPITSDSRVHAKEFNEALREVFTNLSMKKHLLEGLSAVFDIDVYHYKKKNFVAPAFKLNVYAGATESGKESPHPQLHQKLRKLRDSICARADLPIYIVAGTNTLNELSTYLPQDIGELRKISGFGDAKIEKYGKQFLELIVDYCRVKGLSSMIHERDSKRERRASGEKRKKVDTKAESFRLYKAGKNVDEIAKERGFTTQTIEGHLAHYVTLGEIHINELLNESKVLLIEPAVLSHTENSITPIKEKLGQEISFGEIRLVMAWVKFKNTHRPM